MAIFGRQAGDTISTIVLADRDPQGASIALHAGWQANGEPYGAPNDGYFPAGRLSVLVERQCSGSHALRRTADGLDSAFGN